MPRSPEMRVPIEEIQSSESTVEDFELDLSEPNFDLNENLTQEKEILGKYSGKAEKVARMLLLSTTLAVGVGLSSEAEAGPSFEQEEYSESGSQKTGKELVTEAMASFDEYQGALKKGQESDVDKFLPISWRIMEDADAAYRSAHAEQVLKRFSGDDIDTMIWILYALDIEAEKIVKSDSGSIVKVHQSRYQELLAKYEALSQTKIETDKEDGEIDEGDLTEASTWTSDLLGAFRRHLKKVKDEKHAQAVVRTVTNRFVKGFYFPKGNKDRKFTDSDNLLIGKNVENLINLLDFVNDKFPIPNLEQAKESLNRIKGKALRKLDPNYKLQLYYLQNRKRQRNKK
ncbi:hypothetical protein ACFLZY_02955 [Patescibacteria group bacterium]